MHSGRIILNSVRRNVGIFGVAATIFGLLLAASTSNPRQAIAADSSDSVSIDNGEIRTWNDVDGKHSVRAALVRIEADNVVLVRDDNKEVKVPLNTLSDADRQYVDKMKAAKTGTAVDAAPAGDPPAGEAQDPKKAKKTLDLLRAESSVPIDISLAIPLDLTGDGSWKYEPDAAIEELDVRPSQVPLSIAVADHFQAERTLLLPRERKTIAVFKGSANSKEPQSFRSYVCDYEHGRIEGRLATGVDEPIAISPDGSLLLLAHRDATSRENTVLTVCLRSGDSLKRLVTWKPYGDESNGDIKWAEFVDATQLLTLNGPGHVALWSIPDVWPKWAAKMERGSGVAISPGRKFVALSKPDGVKLLRLADGAVVGGIPAKMDSTQGVSFTRDGKQLGVWTADRVRVWDLESASLTHDFGLQRMFVPTERGFSTLDWIDDKHVLLDGRLLVDLAHRVACWQFNNVGATSTVTSNRMWFIDDKSATPKLCSLALPNREAIDAVSRFTPEQMLVLQPGMKVAVEIDNGGGGGDAGAARESLVKKLADNGIAVVPESTVKFVGEIFPGQTQQIRVRNWNEMPTGEGQMHEYTPRTVLLRLLIGGEEVWKRGFTSRPSMFIELKENETVDQALERMTQTSIEMLSIYQLPRYLARIPGDNPP